MLSKLEKTVKVLLSFIMIISLFSYQMSINTSMALSPKEIVKVYWGETEDLDQIQTYAVPSTHQSATPLWGETKDGTILQMGVLYCKSTVDKSTNKMTSVSTYVESRNNFSLTDKMSKTIQIAYAKPNSPANSKFYGTVGYSIAGVSGDTPYIQIRHFYYDYGKWVTAKDTK